MKYLVNVTWKVGSLAIDQHEVEAANQAKAREQALALYSPNWTGAVKVTRVTRVAS